ncbi:hypothetical protein MUN84_14420 [Hymenobacter sp. 5516J-16]|uniref:Uncharacterized protein n=1 Tax=Hymenobacter sublimis TaxID=2933777 RepID=A0ABY4J9L5_9BACT|nr:MULTISPECIES: hypothetical protein [Hymenobacter]UOQ75829.1 hypothetical protein MUN84_14420 [Hymenobacter sp. 5516J-16]UPL49510.1 hypothetical protein MWH26_01015 [Hymenobacter sublimis]
MSKHKKDSPASNQKSDSAMGPDALQHAPSVDPDTRGQSGGTQVQNDNQNGLNEAGNHTRNNAPGGGDSEQERTTQANKPRHNPNPSQQKQK